MGTETINRKERTRVALIGRLLFRSNSDVVLGDSRIVAQQGNKSYQCAKAATPAPHKSARRCLTLLGGGSIIGRTCLETTFPAVPFVYASSGDPVGLRRIPGIAPTARVASRSNEKQVHPRGRCPRQRV